MTEAFFVQAQARLAQGRADAEQQDQAALAALASAPQRRAEVAAREQADLLRLLATDAESRRQTHGDDQRRLRDMLRGQSEAEARASVESAQRLAQTLAAAEERERLGADQTARMQAQYQADAEERERRAADETQRRLASYTPMEEPDSRRSTLEHQLKVGIWRLSARDTSFDPTLKKVMPAFIYGIKPPLVPAIAASAGLAMGEIPEQEHADVKVRFAHLVEALRQTGYTIHNLADVLAAEGRTALADRLRLACQ